MAITRKNKQPETVVSQDVVPNDDGVRSANEQQEEMASSSDESVTEVQQTSAKEAEGKKEYAKWKQSINSTINQREKKSFEDYLFELVTKDNGKMFYRSQGIKKEKYGGSPNRANAKLKEKLVAEGLKNSITPMAIKKKVGGFGQKYRKAHNLFFGTGNGTNSKGQTLKEQAYAICPHYDTWKSILTDCVTQGANMKSSEGDQQDLSNIDSSMQSEEEENVDAAGVDDVEGPGEGYEEGGIAAPSGQGRGRKRLIDDMIVEDRQEEGDFTNAAKEILESTAGWQRDLEFKKAKVELKIKHIQESAERRGWTDEEVDKKIDGLIESI